MKKDNFRFTLRFCSEAPKQITATHVLNAAGKRKSSLIADLIYEHIKRYGENAFSDYFLYSALPKDALRNGTFMQTAVIAENLPSRMSKPSADVVGRVDSSGDKEQSAISTNDETLDDEIHNAVLNGLSMFNRT